VSFALNSATAPPYTGGVSRTYDDPCGLARALDVVGERWTLLMVRELLLGPKRFSELRRGLPGASQSVLTQRLDELQAAGLIRHPAGKRQAYELTQRGRELEPALVELARWGSRTAITTESNLSVDALALAMCTTFDASSAGDLRGRYDLRVDGDCLRLEITDAGLEVTRIAGTVPMLDTSAATLRSLVFGGRDLADAERSGAALVLKNRDDLTKLLDLFPRPTPVDQRDQSPTSSS
jgi:DNA-binding HxlR family transcriptional regulator